MSIFAETLQFYAASSALDGVLLDLSRLPREFLSQEAIATGSAKAVLRSRIQEVIDVTSRLRVSDVEQHYICCNTEYCTLYSYTLYRCFFS